MKYRCTTWLSGFTVGAHYFIHATTGHVTDDEGDTIQLSRETIVTYFTP